MYKILYIPAMSYLVCRQNDAYKFHNVWKGPIPADLVYRTNSDRQIPKDYIDTLFSSIEECEQLIEDRFLSGPVNYYRTEFEIVEVENEGSN